MSEDDGFKAQLVLLLSSEKYTYRSVQALAKELEIQEHVLLRYCRQEDEFTVSARGNKTFIALKSRLTAEKEEAEAIVTSPATPAGGPDAYDTRTQTSPGICVNYKRRVLDATFEGPDTKVLHNDWCTLYDTACTSPSRGADHEECIRNMVVNKTKDYTQHKLEDLAKRDKRGGLLAKLKDLLG